MCDNQVVCVDVRLPLPVSYDTLLHWALHVGPDTVSPSLVVNARGAAVGCENLLGVVTETLDMLRDNHVTNKYQKALLACVFRCRCC
jgi:hypothetical protein